MSQEVSLYSVCSDFFPRAEFIAFSKAAKVALEVIVAPETVSIPAAFPVEVNFSRIDFIAGFAKLLNGTIGGIIAFIAAICLGIFLAGYLAGVSAFVDLQTKISDFFVSKFDVAGYKAKVSDGELFLNVSGSAWTSVSTLFEGSSKLKIVLLVQTVCVKLFSGALTGSVTLAAFAANLIVKALCAIIVFVASIIVLEILFSLLSKLLSKIVEKQKGFRSVDRIIGLVFSAAFTVALVFVAMFVIAKIGSGAQVAIDNIESGTVAKWFYENNPFLLL